MRHAAPLALAALALVSGCAAEEELAPRELTRSSALAPSERRVTREPDALAVAAHRALAPDAIPDALARTLQGAPLPVLLVADRSELYDQALALTGPHWWSLSADLGDHVIYLQGTRSALERASLTAERAPLALERAADPAPYELTRTHGIVSITFERFGVSYTVDVECARPLEDERCTEDDYALSLYGALALWPRDAAEGL